MRTGIDHLLYASSDLQRGMNEIEALLGVRPVRGGRHPQYGTHNALLSLGPGVYLEIIARDPGLPTPARGALVDVPANHCSYFFTWVFRTENIRESANAARTAGVPLGRVEKGRRSTPEGSEIRWKLTDPYALPLNGAIPFLIEWGETAHPSGTAPAGGRFEELVIEHPEADRVRRDLSELGAEVRVVEAEDFLISARIETKGGLVTLR